MENMNILEEARQEAERRWPSLGGASHPATRTPREWLDEGMASGFVLGALWASARADREPSDAEVEAAAEVFWEYDMVDDYRRERARAALLAAQEVRR